MPVAMVLHSGRAEQDKTTDLLESEVSLAVVGVGMGSEAQDPEVAGGSARVTVGEPSAEDNTAVRFVAGAPVAEHSGLGQTEVENIGEETSVAGQWGQSSAVHRVGRCWIEHLCQAGVLLGQLPGSGQTLAVPTSKSS